MSTFGDYPEEFAHFVGDGVADTPAHYLVGVPPEYCSTDILNTCPDDIPMVDPGPDPIRNLMSYQRCGRDLTNGQRERMLAVYETMRLGAIDNGLQPSTTPSLHPSTNTPTKEPSATPVTHPTEFPIYVPTGVPTVEPSESPTTTSPVSSPPTQSPSSHPSGAPFSSPTGRPTSVPPTRIPSGYPSTGLPTLSPTKKPVTAAPTSGKGICPLADSTGWWNVFYPNIRFIKIHKPFKVGKFWYCRVRCITERRALTFLEKHNYECGGCDQWEHRHK